MSPKHAGPPIQPFWYVLLLLPQFDCTLLGPIVATVRDDRFTYLSTL